MSLPYRGFEGPAPAPSPYYRPPSNGSRPFPDVPVSRGSSGTSFRPSIAVIIGVLTTMFSLTFLLLLYAKHCKRSAEAEGAEGPAEEAPAAPAAFHVDGGLDRAVVEALPMFTFASLQGAKVCNATQFVHSIFYFQSDSSYIVCNMFDEREKCAHLCVDSDSNTLFCRSVFFYRLFFSASSRTVLN